MWLYVNSNRPSSKLLLFDFQSHDFLDLLSFSPKMSIFLLELLLDQKVFYQGPSINIFLSTIIDWSLSSFLLQSPIIGLGGFSLATWSYETHQLFYGARMFSLVFQFSSPVSQWVGRVFIKLHLYLYLYVWRSSRLRRKAIVMSWSQDL